MIVTALASSVVRSFVRPRRRNLLTTDRCISPGQRMDAGPSNGVSMSGERTSLTSHVEDREQTVNIEPHHPGNPLGPLVRCRTLNPTGTQAHVGITRSGVARSTVVGVCEAIE